MEDHMNHVSGESNDPEVQAMIRELNNPFSGFLRFGRALQERVHGELQDPFKTFRRFVHSRIMLAVLASLLTAGVAAAGVRKLTENLVAGEQEKTQENFMQQLEEWIQERYKEKRRLENPPPSQTPSQTPSQNDRSSELG